MSDYSELANEILHPTNPVERPKDTAVQRVPKVYDWAAIELDFRNAVEALPNYKRTLAYTYVSALRERIQSLEEEVNSLSSYIADSIEIREATDG